MKNFLAIALLAFTFNVSAAVIHQGTSDRLNSEFIDLGVTHLELETGLEWLDFGTLIAGERTNVTFGHSVDSAIAAYTPQGFRVATESEVTNLFDLFFPTAVYTSGTMSLDDLGGTTPELSEARNSWLFDFGSFVEPTGSLSSLGFYLANDLSIQEAGVQLDTNPLTSDIFGVDYRQWTTASNESYDNRGVFMVREYSVVPVPAAVWLFGTGLLGLVAVARRKA